MKRIVKRIETAFSNKNRVGTMRTIASLIDLRSMRVKNATDAVNVMLASAGFTKIETLYRNAAEIIGHLNDTGHINNVGGFLNPAYMLKHMRYMSHMMSDKPAVKFVFTLKSGEVAPLQSLSEAVKLTAVSRVR